MTTKALITLRKTTATEDSAADVSTVARESGFAVEQDLSNGSIVNVDDESQIAQLEQSGFRVKLLRDTNLLRVGDYQIDTETETEQRVTPAADAPAAMEAD